MIAPFLVAACLAGQTPIAPYSFHQTATITAWQDPAGWCAARDWTPTIGDVVDLRTTMQYQHENGSKEGSTVLSLNGQQWVVGTIVDDVYPPSGFGWRASYSQGLDGTGNVLMAWDGIQEPPAGAEGYIDCMGTVTYSPVIQRPLGDSNNDGHFDTRDLVAVFTAGQYEDGRIANSTWETGDWSSDMEFSSTDLVYALQAGTFEHYATSAVPEPSGLLLMVCGGLLLLRNPVRRV